MRSVKTCTVAAKKLKKKKKTTTTELNRHSRSDVSIIAHCKKSTVAKKKWESQVGSPSVRPALRA